MLKKLPSGQPTPTTPNSSEQSPNGEIFSTLINIIPYILGLLLIQAPSSKADFIEYFQKYAIYIIFILILNLIRSLITKITLGDKNLRVSSSKGLKEKFKSSLNIIIVLLTGALVLFISGFLKYRFNYSERVFQISIVAFSAFFIGESLRRKGYILWYLFFEFTYFTLIGVMSVFCLNEMHWRVALIFASSIAAFIISAKVFDFAISDDTISDDTVSDERFKEQSLNTVSKITPIRISLTYLFFPFFITGLAGTLNILPKRFALLYLVIFGLFRFFERGYVRAGNDKTNFNNQLKYDSLMFAIVYCVVVVALR